MDDDFDSTAEAPPYVPCAHCGKEVFSGVSECPYCLKDPSGETHGCSYCGREIPPDTAQCPYCKNYTDEHGPRQEKKKLSPIWVVAAWLAILATIAPLVLALVQWLWR
jgi:hypothetical protein